MAVQLADGRVVMSGAEELAYLENNPDVTVAISQGQFANASDHFNRYGQFEERGGLPDTENLDTSFIDGSGFLYTNNMDINNPLADPLYRELTGSPDPVSVAPPGGTAGGPPGGPPGGTATFNLTDIPPPDLTPVTSRIGTPTTAQTAADQTTLMGQTAGLATGQAGIMSGQQGIRDVVDPLGAQVTGLETSIGTAGDVDQFGQTLRPVGATRPDASTIMGRQDIIATDLGQVSNRVGRPSMTVAGDDLPATGLFAGQAGIQAGIGQAGEGQTDLFAGQADLAGGQATLSENQAALQAGQTGLGTQIGALGTAAVTDPDTGEVTQKPTGLFAGQAGLMAGQTGLTQDISGLGRELSDVSADIGGQLTGLGGQLGAFRSGVEQYQRGATTQRGDIQGTQRAGQANLLAQIQGVGQQANRAAEMMAQQRQMQTQRQQPAVQQQAAQFAASAPRATPSNQQVGPMGPMASDPRDALIQNLLRRTSLMNRRPV